MTRKLEEAKRLYKTANADQRYVLEKLFPELAESEDERIRKEIINYFTEGKEFLSLCSFDREHILAWLEKQGEKDEEILILKDQIESLHAAIKAIKETHRIELKKQGEQKPFDYEHANIQQKDFAPKAKSKFKVGDYIISNNNSEIIYHITGTGINELGNPDYVCEHVGREKEYNGRIYNMRQDKVDANFRLWTIQDAKDGDVLFMDNGSANCIFIYKSFNNEIINKYASYNNFGFEGEHYLVLNDGYVVPATKEQRDILFQKMKVAGYEWDAEKKELKKIEQKHDDETSIAIKNEEAYKIGFSDGEAHAKEEMESSWSEEDEEYINDLIGVFDGQQYQAHSDEEIVKWLKSIRLPYNKEWDENDEEMLRSIIATCEVAEQDRDSSPARHLFETQANWLKTLRPQNTWKPSDEQMKALWEVYKGGEEQAALASLYSDLKKLKK